MLSNDLEFIGTGTVTRQYGFTAYGLPSSRTMTAAGSSTPLQNFSYTFDTVNGNLEQREDAINYFGKHVRGFNTVDEKGKYVGGWDKKANPIDGVDWDNFNSSSNSDLLNTRLRPSVWDYYASSYFILGDAVRGVINAIRDNKSY